MLQRNLNPAPTVILVLIMKLQFHIRKQGEKKKETTNKPRIKIVQVELVDILGL